MSPVTLRLKRIYRDNRVGLVVIGLMLLGGLGYFIYSVIPGGLTVRLERINEQEAFDILAQATFREYCMQFQSECGDNDKEKLEVNIRTSLEKVARGAKARLGYAKVTYYNGARVPLNVTRLMSKQPQAPWTAPNNRREALLIQQFPLAVAMTRGDLPFQYKVRYALAKATVNHSAPFGMHPKERKIWMLENIGSDREFQIEYSKNGKTYVSGIFRAR